MAQQEVVGRVTQRLRERGWTAAQVADALPTVRVVAQRASRQNCVGCVSTKRPRQNGHLRDPRLQYRYAANVLMLLPPGSAAKAKLLVPVGAATRLIVLLGGGITAILSEGGPREVEAVEDAIRAAYVLAEGYDRHQGFSRRGALPPELALPPSYRNNAKAKPLQRQQQDDPAYAQAVLRALNRAEVVLRTERAAIAKALVTERPDEATRRAAAVVASMPDVAVHLPRSLRP